MQLQDNENILYSKLPCTCDGTEHQRDKTCPPVYNCHAGQYHQENCPHEERKMFEKHGTCLCGKDCSEPINDWYRKEGWKDLFKSFFHDKLEEGNYGWSVSPLTIYNFIQGLLSDTISLSEVKKILPLMDDTSHAYEKLKELIEKYENPSSMQ